MRNCGVSKNNVVVQLQVNSFITPKIATTSTKHWSKQAQTLFVSVNTAEWNVSQEKKNYHETIHSSAISLKETI